MQYEYYLLFISFALGCIISLALYTIVNFFSYKNVDMEKISSYECGFHPFEDTRQKFNVRFYLVSIIFLVFDLEIVFLFPWIACIYDCGLHGYWVMFIFLLILTIGFIYEWLKGALTWE